MPNFNGPSRRRRAGLSLSILCAGAILAAATAAVLGPADEAQCPSAAHPPCRAAGSLSPLAGATGETDLMPVSRLLGSPVTGADHRRVGTVADVLLDRDGRIAAVTLDVGAFLGVPTRRVAVPPSQLHFASAGEPPSSGASPRHGPPASEEGRLAGVMQDLMTGNGQAWQASAAHHISVNLTRPEVGKLPSFVGR